VDQLVAEHVIGRLERACQRQNDAPFQCLGHAPGPFTDLAAKRIRLAEVWTAGVEDQRLASAQLVIQDA